MEFKTNKILIVDDNSCNIFALRAVLCTRGFNCVSATGARECILMLSEDTEIGIVLMDMMMPDINGYEAIAMILKSEQLARIPIIAVTAHAMVGDKEKCLQAGAAGYISKPVNIDILLALLSKHLK